MCERTVFALALMAGLVLMACEAEQPAQSAASAQPVQVADEPEARSIEPYTPHFVPAECTFELPTDLRTECGYLEVPESRTTAGSPTIRLPVAVLKSYSATPAQDPLVFLTGGPGAYALDQMPWLSLAFLPVLEQRDVIVFDQRGTGHAEPSLDCPEVSDVARGAASASPESDEAHRRSIEAVIACRERLLEEAVDLSAYNTAASAADLRDLRGVLGIQEWNLYGVSYGSRLALTSMRDDSEGLRSVVLDSVYPPHVDIYAELADNANRAFNLLFESCRVDEACNRLYPHLDAAFYELVDVLDREPIIAQVTDPGTGQAHEVVVDGDELIEFLFLSMYSTQAIPWLPKLIYDLRQGDTTELVRQLPATALFHDRLSQGMNYSVQCAEAVPWSVAGTAAAQSVAYPRLQVAVQEYIERYFEVCEAWGVEAADPSEHRPVQSHVPTLVLSGEFDPVTPPAWGAEAAVFLHNAYDFEFRSVSHGVLFANDCALALALDFLDAPDSPPDSTCLQELEAPEFIVSE